MARRWETMEPFIQYDNTLFDSVHLLYLEVLHDWEIIAVLHLDDSGDWIYSQDTLNMELEGSYLNAKNLSNAKQEIEQMLEEDYVTELDYVRIVLSSFREGDNDER